MMSEQWNRGLKRTPPILFDETAPGLAALVTQHQAPRVGDAGDRSAEGVAETVANRVVGAFFRCATPDVAKLIAQADEIAVAESGEPRSGVLLLQTEPASRQSMALAPAPVDHSIILLKLWSSYHEQTHLAPLGHSPEKNAADNTRMRVVLQRVSQASVTVSGEVVGEIGPGFVVLVGVARGDSEPDADYLTDKIINLRVFADDEGRMNRSLLETGGELLVISQFTLYGDCRKGRRPDFTKAAPSDEARRVYDYFVRTLREKCDIRITTGVFQAEMDVALTNHGPVTLICDSIAASAG